MAAERAGWYCWRNERPGAPEIFTDGPSRAVKYERMAVPMVLLVAIQAPFVFQTIAELYRGERLAWYVLPLVPLSIGATGYALYAWLKLRARARALRGAVAL